MFSSFTVLNFLNVLDLTSPILAVTAALIYNTIIIIALLPLAIRGVSFRPSSANELLKRNLLLYGIGGAIFPFLAIKVIYMLLILGGVSW